ncbi:heavy metal translocating P-type ATPase [Thermodesulfobacteriota bacterium]
MHDVSREAIIETELSPVHAHGDTAFDKFLERYGEFINPLLCIILVTVAWVKGEAEAPWIYLALAACVLSGYPIVRNSIISTITNKRLNAEVLVTCALIASIWVGEYVAGAIVVLMMNIGELLEDITIAKTGEAVRSLMELEADTARVIRNGREVEIDIEDVEIGDIALVRSGEKIPIDGIVKDGRGEVNQAPITGESVLIAKEAGDEVYGGTLNQVGVLKIEVTRSVEETTISKIIELVHKAQAEKPPIERIADQFAAWFTPVMLILAGLVWLVTGEVLRAVTVLVVACPCALVIATPTAVVAGIGNAARRGILIKGGAVLEVIGKLTTFVFDKTGTLTYGAPSVSHIETFGDSSIKDVLSLAGTAERHSEHPLAEAILKRCNQEEAWPFDPDDTEVLVGRGIVARKDSRDILVGNPRLFEEKGIPLTDEAVKFLESMADSGSTGVLVGRGPEIVGGIGIADLLKEDVHESIRDIKRLGIQKVIMLTGDNQKVAQTISAGAGLDEIVADLMPEGKLEHIKKMKAAGEKVAMVGDGINDAPALVEADVGIAMGVIGTDAAIEAADIALTSDDLSKAAEAIALSRKTVQIIKQSLVISVAINGVALVLASTGDIGPIVGAIIHNIGSIVVVGNSSRLIGYRFKL